MLTNEDLWTVKDLYERFQEDLDVLEAAGQYEGTTTTTAWELDLGDGVTVKRMTQRSDPTAWVLGAGNFIFLIDGMRFAILGASQVHDQLHLRTPLGLEDCKNSEVSFRWHRAANRILEFNHIPYVVLHPLNVTVPHGKGGHGPRIPLMRQISASYDDDYESTLVDAGTNFVARVHGQPWERCPQTAPGEWSRDDFDAHINHCLGLTKVSRTQKEEN